METLKLLASGSVASLTQSVRRLTPADWASVRQSVDPMAYPVAEIQSVKESLTR